MEEILLSAEDLTVGYRSKPVVESINFRIRGGEILTLIGPNGAGKSTLLKTLAGYLKQLHGTVCLQGVTAEQFTDHEKAKLLSVVLTERIRPELMTCQEVVETGRYPYTGRFGRLTPQDHDCVNRAIATVEMESFANSDFNHVSDGQRQRVLLARAICQEPEILILDEPTSFLDIHHKIIFFEILQKLAKEQQLAVIVSIHELDFAKKISDTTLCVKDGRIVSAGSPEEIFTPGKLQELYDIPPDLYQKYFV